MVVKRSSLAAVILVTAVVAAYAMHRAHVGGPGVAAVWERAVSPGALSAAHADLEGQCDSCHTPVAGVERAKCATCHASEDVLMTRAPTAFHADIEVCTGCHVEHRGVAGPVTTMDHEFLAQHGLEVLRRDHPGEYETTLGLIRAVRRYGDTSRAYRDAGAPAALLDCSTCHAADDRHWGLFGDSCIDCHALQSWSLAEFRHPSPRSAECSQCHQAPPSHYMMHFRMVSEKVAGEHAPVTECYVCHQTTSWNDIRRVGVYKHH